MHKLCSLHAFSHCILWQNEWDLPNVWNCWLLTRAQANTHPSCLVGTQGLNRAQLSPEQSWIQSCRTGSIGIHQSTQPAHCSHLMRLVLLFRPFETSLPTYLDTSQIHAQSKLSVVSTRLQIHAQLVRQQGNIHNYQPEAEFF